jgi:hypothetical protein
MAKKSKKQIKIEQANMQSDNVQMTSDGIQYTGGDDTFTYSFADLDDEFDQFRNNVHTTSLDIDGLTFGPSEEELRSKYPALKDAWDHYNNVKHMCEQKEKENED